VLHCPWHGWEFDLDSGRCPEDVRMRVAVYPVKIESGRVLIDA
jgi:nitrite reductase (NADH) small subunit